jgi:hypothetical protein
VLVAVIPSELQVNAALRAEVLAAHDLDETDLDLDAPVRFLTETLRGTGATLVDLRPAITRADAEEPAYHLRDTHWTVHGNRAAADALVEPLAELLERAR